MNLSICQHSYGFDINVGFSIKDEFDQILNKIHEEKGLNQNMVTMEDFHPTENKNIYFNNSLKEEFNCNTLSCDECNLKFSLKLHLNFHKKYMHKARRYSCDTCTKAFEEKKDFNNHLKTHYSCDSHTGKVSKHSGEQCKKCFDSKLELKTHIKLVHEIKIFACNQCELTFYEKYHLKQHINSLHEISKLIKIKRLTYHNCLVIRKKFKRKRKRKLDEIDPHIIRNRKKRKTRSRIESNRNMLDILIYI